MAKRIIHFVDSSGIGGIETHIHLISKHLKKNNLDIEVVFFNDYGEHPLEKKLLDDEIRYKKLNSSIWSIMRYLKSSRCDVLHTHGYKAGIIGKLLGLFLRIKVVSTYHSGDLGTGIVKYYTKLDEALSFLCAPLSVSKEIQNRLPVNSVLIKNSVEVPALNIFPSKINNIGFVGRLSHEKAPDIFLSIAKHRPDIAFHLYGDGEMRADLEENAPKNLIFHGFCSDMSKVWSEIDLLIMPSRQEGLPLAALEAMSHGIPLIASNVGDLPKLITNEKNGYICEKENLDDFTSALDQWNELSAKEKKSVSYNAYKRIRDDYNIEHEIQNLISIYNKEHRDKKLTVHGRKHATLS